MIQTSNSGIPLEMQWRFSALNESRFVTVITAVAFRFGETRVTLDINRDVLMAVNGEPVVLAQYPQKQLVSSELGLVMSDFSDVIELEYEDWLFSIRVGTKHLNITTSAQEETADIVGLLGNLDGIPDNDLVSRDGNATLGPEATLDDLYTVFLNSWRVTDDTSLFDYDTGESTATYTDLTFPTFPEGVASKVTFADDFSSVMGLDTRRAEGACTRAGVTDEPMFGNCVADYVLSGSTEYIVGQQQTLDIARRDRINRFGEGISGHDLIWWQIFPGNIGLGASPELVVSNGRILLVRSLDEMGVSVIDAIDGQTGRKLWRMQDTQNECTPVSFGDNHMVLQADGGTEFGGNDRTNDLLLVDALTGDVVDRWEPTSGSLRACSAPLQATDDNLLVLVNDTVQRGFNIVNDRFELVWEHRFDGRDDFSSGRDLELVSHTVLQGNSLYLVSEDSADDGSRQHSIYQLDTKTGLVVDRLQTSISDAESFFAVGPSHVALVQSQTLAPREGILLLIDTPAPNTNESMKVLWEHSSNRAAEPKLSILGEAAAYSDNGTFGIWAASSDLRNAYLAEFDLLSGDVNAVISTKLYYRFESLLRLDNGNYLHAPPVVFSNDTEPGAPMVRSLSAENEIAWSIDRVEGIEYPQALHFLDNERLVMVVPLTNVLGETGPTYTDWAVVAMGTRR